MLTHCDLVILVVLALSGQGHTGKIYGGHEAAAHSRPYMVHLERMVENGKTVHCGGFLLREDFVMTAAHCNARSYTVLLGLHNYHNRQNAQKILVEKAFLHPDYDSMDYKHDLMLLKLSSNATFNNNVKSIDLADKEDSSPESCITCGWGNFNCEKRLSPTLREVNVTLLNSTSCKKDHSYCSDGPKGPGVGDSGGPLVCEKGKAYGVVSAAYVQTSGGLKVYHYAKIPDYRDWIDSIMENN
uniref:trypsin n=1 Tax=Sphaeramia orbicularis TaxID=375764 RepID=A0A672YWR1_9TELE